jgi:hypothetical protein
MIDMAEPDIKLRKLTMQDMRYTPIVHLNENADARATIQVFCAAAVQSALQGLKYDIEMELPYYLDTDEHDDLTPEIIKRWIDKWFPAFKEN